MSDLRPWVAKLLERNNQRIQRIDGGHPNPRPVADIPWYRDLSAAHPRIRAEWDRFVERGGDIPLIEQTLGHPDQNEGSYWKMTPFVNLGRGVPQLATDFPDTIAALRQVPGLRSASWSVLGPGGWLPEHVGPNGGCLRLLFAVTSSSALLTVNGIERSFADGEGTIFEDTVPHAVHNPGPDPRVVILGDLLRPLPGLTGWRNRAVQRTLHSMTPAYRGCAQRGAEHYERINRSLTHVS